MTTSISAGTVTVANGGTTVTGTDTFWIGKVFEGDLFTDPAQGLFARVTADATSNTALSINAWPGAALADAAYEVILQADSIRMSERTRQLLEALSLVEPNYDAQVADLPGRAAYDDELGPSGGDRGFAVLVSNVGDGRAAIYSKLSNASGDWSDPAYVTGPLGPEFDVAVGTTTTLPPDQPATVTRVPVPGGARLDFAIPRGPTGDINGVTPFWNARLGVDVDAEAARKGLGIVDKTLAYSVSPIPIEMHFDILAGVGWSASEPGNIVATTVTASTASTITVASAATFFVGQLICYVATDGQYYRAVIKGIAGNTFTFDRFLEAPAAVGAPFYNVYRDDAHCNTHGFAMVADGLLRQAVATKALVHQNANPGQWENFGSVTRTNETANTYANPGSSTVAALNGVRVQGSSVQTGVLSPQVTLAGGTYETELVVNPGTRDGGFSGQVRVNIIITNPDGTQDGVEHFTDGFGDSCRVVRLKYRVRDGAKVQVRVLEPQGGPWTFWVGVLRHYRILGKIRSLNWGRNLFWGDSWINGGDLFNRFVARLDQAECIKQGTAGGGTAGMIAEFAADIAPKQPDIVWVVIGTNDAYAGMTATQFRANIDKIIGLIQSIGAIPIIVTTSVCSVAYAPPKLDMSRQYATTLQIANREPAFGLPELAEDAEFNSVLVSTTLDVEGAATLASLAVAGSAAVAGTFAVGVTGVGSVLSYNAGNYGRSDYRKSSTGAEFSVTHYNSAGVNVGGITYSETATALVASSDYRLKGDIIDLLGSGEFIDGLTPRAWTWASTGQRGVGFIAHELQAVSPESVHGEKDAVDENGTPIYQAIDASSPEIIANLVAQVKALRLRVAELESSKIN